MKEYIAELGHIIGSVGQLIHHAATLLTLTAQHLTKGADEPEPQPEGATSQAEHSHTFTAMPEMHANYRGAEEEGDGVYKIGFRSNK